MPKISSLAPADAFDGSEIGVVVQDGHTRRYTAEQLAAFLAGGSLTERLKQWAAAQAFIGMAGATFNAENVLLSANVTWPDGTAGVLTTDAVDALNPAINAYHVTYLATPVRTVTQPLMTRNADGAVTDQPALTVT